MHTLFIILMNAPFAIAFAGVLSGIWFALKERNEQMPHFTIFLAWSILILLTIGLYISVKNI